MSFVHLRVHTEYSLVDSVVRISRMMGAAVGGGMPAIALSDQSNMFALIKFYRAAIKAGVKPVIGVDARIANPEGFLSPVVLLAQNMEGYLNLSKLVSRSYQEGQSERGAVVEFSWLEDQTEGIIALSGGRTGDVGRALLAEYSAEAEQCLKRWQKQFPDRFYIELQRTGRADEERYNQAAIQLAGKAACPVVATNDVRFIKPEEFEAHEIRVCIHQGLSLIHI